MKDLLPELSTNRVKIRKLTLSDAKAIHGRLRDKRIVRWTLNIPWPYTIEDAKRFIRKASRNIKNKRGYAFGIALKEADEVIGVIDLSNIDWRNKHGKVGYWMGSEYWGKGLMAEAVKLILKFGFEHLKLHRIHASLFEENTASRKVLEKCSFKREGTKREARLKSGKWHNVLQYGILSREYKRKDNLA